MRLIIALYATLLLSGLAFAQAPVRGYTGGFAYGPYVPLITTPEISLGTASPAPVGASNATYGLQAGARNSTLEMLNENTSSNYTEPVWYSGGGAPVVSPEISLEPRPVRMHREMHIMMDEHHGQHGEAGDHEWVYFGASEMETSIDTGAGKSARHATRTITNDDIDRANQNTGTVKYDGKSEKIQ